MSISSGMDVGSEGDGGGRISKENSRWSQWKGCSTSSDSALETTAWSIIDRQKKEIISKGEDCLNIDVGCFQFTIKICNHY